MLSLSLSTLLEQIFSRMILRTCTLNAVCLQSVVTTGISVKCQLYICKIVSIVLDTLLSIIINSDYHTGILFPEGLKYLKNAEDREEVRRICERFGPYKDLYNGVGDGPNDKTLEDKFFEEEVKFNLIGVLYRTYFDAHFDSLTSTLHILINTLPLHRVHENSFGIHITACDRFFSIW